jgi:hypothetical protein
MLRLKPLLVMWGRLWGEAEKNVGVDQQVVGEAIFCSYQSFLIFSISVIFLHCPSIRFLLAMLATLLMMWGR